MLEQLDADIMVVWILFLGMGAQSYALSCDVDIDPGAHTIFQYDFIFEGTIIKRTTSENRPSFTIWRLAGLYEFVVHKVWKGEPSIKKARVWASTTYYGYAPYKTGETVIVYAYKKDGDWITTPGFCGPDHVYSSVEMRMVLDGVADEIDNERMRWMWLFGSDRMLPNLGF